MRSSGVAAALFLLALLPASAQEKLYVVEGSPMRYLANAADPDIGMAWTQPGFDDASWSTGSFGVGYEAVSGAENLIETAVPPGTRSVFTRVVFTVADVSAVSRLSVAADYDDGVVFWLNGQEVHRSAQMPAGPLAWDSTPADHESSNGLDPSYMPLIDISASGIPVLQNGENVLAVGVWNTGTTSSDLLLVPLLVGDPESGLIRGPYLQTLTPTSVRVRWRTAAAQDGVVAYGTAIGALSQSVTAPTPTTEHDVLLRRSRSRHPVLLRDRQLGRAARRRRRTALLRHGAHAGDSDADAHLGPGRLGERRTGTVVPCATPTSVSPAPCGPTCG